MNINKRVLDYVLRHREQYGTIPTAKKVAQELDIGKTTAQKYIYIMKEQGIIEVKKERPGEDKVFQFIKLYDEIHGEYPPEKKISESLEIARSTVRGHVLRMIREGRIENKNGAYSVPTDGYSESRRTERDKKRLDDGVRLKDIESLRHRIKEGDRVLVEDGNGELGPSGIVVPVYANVVKVNKWTVILTNRLSCQLSQIAAGEKKRKGKTWVAKRWMNYQEAILKS